MEVNQIIHTTFLCFMIAWVHSWIIILIENMSSDKVAQSPSQLPRVCVGPELGSQSRVNISWDPLPCHLQNGANIRDYIIQYTKLPGGQPKFIYSSTDSKVECHQEPGSPYLCLAASLFFIPHVTYSFQVAAQNSFGVGSYSNSVIILYGSNGNHYYVMYYGT